MKLTDKQGMHEILGLVWNWATLHYFWVTCPWLLKKALFDLGMLGLRWAIVAHCQHIHTSLETTGPVPEWQTHIHNYRPIRRLERGRANLRVLNSDFDTIIRVYTQLLVENCMILIYLAQLGDALAPLAPPLHTCLNYALPVLFPLQQYFSHIG